jgi:hypothetical protein
MLHICLLWYVPRNIIIDGFCERKAAVVVNKTCGMLFSQLIISHLNVTCVHKTFKRFKL